MKVYLSPSNQPNNKCVFGHSEKQHCEQLVQLMLPMLHARGIQFKVRQAGGTSDWVRESNAWGADLHLPIHTNAASGTARGTRFGFYPGRKDSADACLLFKKNWVKLYPYPDKVKTCTYNFAEAKNPKCPSVYCETVFHDNKADATWFHENMNKIAQNFVESICEVLGVKELLVNLKLTKQENADFHKVPVGAVVALDVEDYLKGVVPAEVGNAPLEACKAQAIAARSILLSGRWPSTIDDTTTFQAYSAPRGADSDYARAHQGAKDTAGVVLLYQGKIACTFYADSNGGMMKASDEHWNQNTPYEQREHIPYLVTKPDPWTAASGKPYKGHPVGMSQQGAIWAANQGIKHKEILEFYYPGTVLSNEPVKEPEIVNYKAKVNTAGDLTLGLWADIRKSNRLMLIPKGARVTVLEEVNATWAQVEYNGQTGFVDRQYLVREPDAPTPPPVTPPADTVQIPRAAWDAFLEAFERVLKAVG